MTPGVVIMTTLGHRVAQVLTGGDGGQIVLLALAVGLWLGVSAGLQVALARLRLTTGA